MFSTLCYDIWLTVPRLPNTNILSSFNLSLFIGHFIFIRIPGSECRRYSQFCCSHSCSGCWLYCERSKLSRHTGAYLYIASCHIFIVWCSHAQISNLCWIPFWAVIKTNLSEDLFLCSCTDFCKFFKEEVSFFRYNLFNRCHDRWVKQCNCSRWKIFQSLKIYSSKRCKHLIYCNTIDISSGTHDC